MTMPEPVNTDAGPPEPSTARRASLRSLATLVLSLCALAFMVWIVVVHPNHQSIFGPAPSPAAIAASAPHPSPPTPS